MRVAVHSPDGSVTAYHLGRVEDGVHNMQWHTGQRIPIEEFIDGLVEQAKADYPDCEIVVERLVHPENDGEDGAWIPAAEFDPEKHRAMGHGDLKAHSVAADQSVAADGEGA